MSKNSTAANKAKSAAARSNVEQTAVVVATPAPAPMVQAGAPAGLRMVKQITLPALAMKTEGAMYYLKLMDEFRISKVEGKVSADGTKEKPATICTAVDVASGVNYTLLVPAVVQKNLDQEYPGGAYVGKIFAIANRGKRSPTQRYYDFDIAECAMDAGA